MDVCGQAHGLRHVLSVTAAVRVAAVVKQPYCSYTHRTAVAVKQPIPLIMTNHAAGVHDDEMGEQPQLASCKAESSRGC